MAMEMDGVMMDVYAPEVGLDDLPPELVRILFEEMLGFGFEESGPVTLERWQDVRGLVCASRWTRDVFYRGVRKVHLNFRMTELDVPAVLRKCGRMEDLVLERAVGVAAKPGVASLDVLSSSPTGVNHMSMDAPMRLKSLTLSYCYQIKDSVLDALVGAQTLEDLRIVACDGLSWRAVWRAVTTCPVKKLVYCPARMICDAGMDGEFLGDLDQSMVQDLCIGALSVPEGWIEKTFRPTLVGGLSNVKKFSLSGIQARDLSVGAADVLASLIHLESLKFHLLGLPLKDNALANFMEALMASSSLKLVEFLAFGIGDLESTVQILNSSILEPSVADRLDGEAEHRSANRFKNVQIRFSFQIANRECDWKLNKTDIIFRDAEHSWAIDTSVRSPVTDDYVAKYVRHDSPWA